MLVVSFKTALVGDSSVELDVGFKTALVGDPSVELDVEFDGPLHRSP